MNEIKIRKWILFFFVLSLIHSTFSYADGGYFSSKSVAVSADQRAIIIQNGNEISMTFSTGYTGEGEDFGWIIPVPVPPDIEDISESSEKTFQVLDEYTAPELYTIISSGCFPSGTEVQTANGLRTIETIDAGTNVYACDLATGEWVFARVLKRQSFHYKGDMITIHINNDSIQATGNQPFYVLRGERLESRPLPKDVPEEEQRATGHGRWVEARDLKEGDLLKDRNGTNLIITGLSSRKVKTQVYCLEIERYHNCTVHRLGILVHNGGKKEGGEPSEVQLVSVYGTVTLAHYEVSVIGSADVSALLDWLNENSYQVNTAAREVLNTYIEKDWAFAAVKLNPGERRHYENEFLPPLTIKYQHDQLIFPLQISSVSTTTDVGITLYVIAESTVSSSNLPTMTLDYDEQLTEWIDAGEYIESCIQRTLANHSNGLVLMWSGELDKSVYRNSAIKELIKTPFWILEKKYLTRLETRMNPGEMIEDILLTLDSLPQSFLISIDARGGWGSELINSAREEDTETVRDLLETGVDMHVKDEKGKTALMHASEQGYSAIVEMLLDVGADVNDVHIFGFTALMFAAKYSHLDIVKMILLQTEADVNVMSEDGLTALMFAAKYGHLDIIKNLLLAGADVSVEDRWGRTALGIAVNYGHTEIVQILLEAGARE